MSRTRRFLPWRALVAPALVVGAICASGADPPATPSEWTWNLPPGFPAPRLPPGASMSHAQVELGRTLFYDTRLSRDGSMSCASCHRQELAFTDGLDRPTGVTGERHPRSAMSLANVAYAVHLTWDDPSVRDLETQLTTPIFGHDPIEMGMERSEDLLRRLRDDWLMQLAFQAAFGAPEPEGEPIITMDRLARAIAAFERTLISGDSPYDRYAFQNQSDALSPSAERGMKLFYSKRLACSECHKGFNFSGPFEFQGSRDHKPTFHNTGLYNLAFEKLAFEKPALEKPALENPGDTGEFGAYPPDNHGLKRHTGRTEDMGGFKAPTLRNIAVTAPYMHDGSIPDLDGVIDHYARGGRLLTDGPYAGDGSKNPWKSERLTGFTLSDDERRDLIAFLHALTDESFLTDPRFGDPRFGDPRFGDPRFGDPRSGDPRSGPPP